MHLQALSLTRRRKQRLTPQQLPQNATQSPCINGRAVAAAAEQQLWCAVPQGDYTRGEAAGIWVEVPVRYDNSAAVRQADVKRDLLACMCYTRGEAAGVLRVECLRVMTK
jgi:hypothetical protein